MAVITPQDFSGASISGVTFAAASGGGDTVVGGFSHGAGGQETELHVRNAGGGIITVTVTLGNASVIGPINVPATTGHSVIAIGGGVGQVVAAVAYSGVTSVTVAALRRWT